MFKNTHHNIFGRTLYFSAYQYKQVLKKTLKQNLVNAVPMSLVQIDENTQFLLKLKNNKFYWFINLVILSVHIEYLSFESIS